MMKLVKLEMNGFKSFSSSTDIAVGSGITAIVGPNGCGKSNIADAINWVIGEQSTKSLRAEHMGDVIFNGTDARKPMGLAEVTLHLEAAAGGGMQAPAGSNGNGAHAGDGSGESEPESEEARESDGAARPEELAGANGDGAPTPENGSAPIEIRDAVRITRRLFRSGESEYLIDGQKRRLRDVQELLATIHVGTGVYSIIEQGRVDSVITSRPRERRVLIEEAAGISLYKVRKRQAQAKLEATEANLLRINDIVSELERQIASLKRQAARARRYARVTEAIDRNERIFIYQEAVKLDNLAAVLRARRAELQAAESEASAVLGKAEAVLVEARAAETRESALHQESRDALHELDRAIDALKARVEKYTEQEAEAAAQIERGTAEIAGLNQRLSEGRARAGELAGESAEVSRQCAAREGALREAETVLRLDAAALAGLESALEAAREDVASLTGDLGEARNEIRRLTESIERTQAELGRLDTESDAAAAEEALLMERRAAQQGALSRSEEGLAQTRAEAGASAAELVAESARREEILMERQEKIGRAAALEERLAGLRSVHEDLAGDLEGLEGAGQLALLKDLLSPPENLDRAVDAALRGLLLGYVAPSLDAAVAMVGSLRERGRGRAIVIPAASHAGRAPRDLPRPVSGLGTLRDLLDPEGRLGPGLAAILGGVIVAADFDAALSLRAARPDFDVVTLQGDLLSRDGWIEGGAQLPEEAGVMTLKRLVERLAAETEATQERIGALVGEMEAAEGRMEALRARERAAREREATLVREVEALRHKTESIGEEASRVSMKREVQDGERTRLREDLVLDTREMETRRRGQEELMRRRDELTRRLEHLTGASEDARMRLAERTNGLAGLREGAAAARERRAAVEAEVRHHDSLVSEMEQRLRKENEEAERWKARLAEARTRKAEDGAIQSDKMAERILASGRVASTEAVLQERRQSLAGLESAEREARAGLDAERARRHQLDIEEEHAAGDRRNLEARVAEKGLPGIPAATEDLTDEERAKDPALVAEEMAELKRKRDSMGPVNLMAMEQFRELEERHAFISSQRADLQESIKSLQDTITKINRQSRERFLEAYDRIRAHFSELFTILFGGGKADIRLVMENEGEEDVLEAGLEISAQPPGKRLQSLSLLSGGEKALTAVALLFAIFKYQPSPFCLLDEVDAPLDEANVNRFVSLLKRMSEETQFIVVSHNRRTMEAADLLYGVTMEEPGVSRTISVVMGTDEARREAVRTLPEMMASRHRGNGKGPRPAPPAQA